MPRPSRSHTITHPNAAQEAQQHHHHCLHTHHPHHHHHHHPHFPSHFLPPFVPGFQIRRLGHSPSKSSHDPLSSSTATTTRRSTPAPAPTPVPTPAPTATPDHEPAGSNAIGASLSAGHSAGSSRPIDEDGIPIRRSMTAPERPTLPLDGSTHSPLYMSGAGWPSIVPEETSPEPPDASSSSQPVPPSARRPTFPFVSAKTTSALPTETTTNNNPDVADSRFIDPRVVDTLTSIDPTLATIKNLADLQNSMFLPFSFRGRQPTLSLDLPPRDTPSPAPQKPPPQKPALPRPATSPPKVAIPPPAQEDGLEAGLGEPFDMSPASSVSTDLEEKSRYAIFPPDVSLDDWSDDEKRMLDEYVRHMLHSRRSKTKQSFRAFIKYASTPIGFFITLYATLITLFGLAWVLFLIGWINMGEKQLDAINIIDYVLVALFAIMGDGLAPFRAIDTYRMVHIVHYARLSWKIRDQRLLPKLKNKNDLPNDFPGGEKAANSDGQEVDGDEKNSAVKTIEPVPLTFNQGGKSTGEAGRVPTADEEGRTLTADEERQVMGGDADSLGSSASRCSPLSRVESAQSVNIPPTDRPVSRPEEHPEPQREFTDSTATSSPIVPSQPQDVDVEEGRFEDQESTCLEEAESRYGPEYSVLTSKQQACLQHHQFKFAKSHTFYRPHETMTHFAFPLNLLFWIVILFDFHSIFQIALGACTFGIEYKNRPMALTTVLLCCSLTCNITAGVLIFIGDRRTRKPEVLKILKRQKLTSQAIKHMQKKNEHLKPVEEEEEPSASTTRTPTTPTSPRSVRVIRRSLSGMLRRYRSRSASASGGRSRTATAAGPPGDRANKHARNHSS